MIKTGVVIEVNKDMALVEAVRQSACDGCHTKAFCPSCQKKITVNAYNEAGARAGDTVEVGTPSGVVLKYAALIFLLPLVAGIGFYLLGKMLFASELIPYLFSFLFFAGSFLFLGFFLNRRESKKKDTITVVKILKNAEMAEPSDLIDGEEENGKG